MLEEKARKAFEKIRDISDAINSNYWTYSGRHLSIEETLWLTMGLYIQALEKGCTLKIDKDTKNIQEVKI